MVEEAVCACSFRNEFTVLLNGFICLCLCITLLNLLGVQLRDFIDVSKNLYLSENIFEIFEIELIRGLCDIALPALCSIPIAFSFVSFSFLVIAGRIPDPTPMVLNVSSRIEYRGRISFSETVLYVFDRLICDTEYSFANLFFSEILNSN